MSCTFAALHPNKTRDGRSLQSSIRSPTRGTLAPFAFWDTNSPGTQGETMNESRHLDDTHDKPSVG